MNPSTRLSDSFREKINRPSTRALNLGFIYFKNGELTEAESLARESLKSEKSDKGYRLLGEVLLSQNRTREALEAFSQSLEMNPRQEFCLNKVCELIDRNPASVERLEFWAHQAARYGFLDISSNFVKASQEARQAGFPNNAALTKVAKDIAQTETKANQSMSFSFNSGRPSLNASTSSSKLEESMEMANKSIGQILDEVKQLHSANASQENQLNELRQQIKELTLLVATKPNNPATAPTGQVNAAASAPIVSSLLSTPSATSAHSFSNSPTGSAFSFGAPAPQKPPAVAATLTTPAAPSAVFAPPVAVAPAAPVAPAATATSAEPAVTLTAPKLNFFQEALKSQEAEKTTNSTNSAPDSTFSFKFGGPPSFSSFTSPPNPSKPLFAGFGAPSQPIFGAKPSPIFGAKPSPLFSQPPSNSTNAADDDDNHSDPEADHIDASQLKLPQLKNIPAKIEVRTGEEDEELVYSQRAKVFRFDTNTKEWKERGIGDLKILLHKQTKKYRILMRREQVHKIAVNFYITSDLEIKPRKNADNSAEFMAVDCSDDEPALSGFAVKFKNKELLDIFRTKVEEIKSIIASGETNSPSKSTSAPSSTPSAQSSSNSPAAAAFSFGAPAPQKPSAAPANPTTPAAPSTTFSPPAPAATGTSAEPAVTLTAPKLNFFQEALKAQEAEKTTSSTNSAPNNTFSFKFGGPPTFSSPPNSQPLFAGFGAPPQPIFGAKPSPIFGAKPSPIFSKPPSNSTNAADDDDNHSDPEADHIDASQLKLPQLKNIPAKIEVKTGEEDEEVIYSQRAKVFRFDSNTKEWKERGIGDLKILSHKQTKKYRILMRREQVHKIAVNFYITSDLEIKPRKNADNSADFTAVDCSDDQPALTGFAVKFKNKELLDIFRAKVEEIKSIIASGEANTPSKSTSAHSSAPEVEIIFERKPKPALIEEAKKLMLPENFYNHLTAEGCTGCRGCPEQDEKDDES